MKSKLTSILMFFIIIAILLATGLLGMIIFEEVTNYLEASELSNPVEDFQFENQDDPEPQIVQNIEVPKIRTASNDNPLEVKTKEPEINYDTVTVNKYFYSQLDKYSQTIYKAFEKNKGNMKSGTYKINLGSTFSNILAKENGKDELGDYYQSAIEAYIYDNPDVFYLSPSKMYLNIETTTKGNQKTYNVYIDNGEVSNYLVEEFSTKREVEATIEEIEDVRDEIIRKRTGNTYRDIKMVHDYLVDNIDYDTTVSGDNIYNLYGALVEKSCVCEGYAKALKYLLDGLGIESTLVIGKGTNSVGNSENHAWNYVKIDESWYAIDATWDDPVIMGGGFLGNDSKYKYFLKGSVSMDKDHFPSGKFTEEGISFEYPELSKNDY